MADITRLSGLEFINGPGTIEQGFYVPNMTTEEIQKIPADLLKFGGMVFDKTTEELLTYTAAGFWLPILTAESDMTVTDLDVTGTATINNLNANISTLNIANIHIGNIDTATVGTATISTIQSDKITTNMLAGSGPNDDISPLTVTLDAGAGTGATSIIKGSIISGTFQLHTGVSPSMGNIIGTFTIPSAYTGLLSGTYGVTFMPANAVTSVVPVFVSTGSPTNLFIFQLGPVTLDENQTYKWNYHIIGNQKTF